MTKRTTRTTKTIITITIKGNNETVQYLKEQHKHNDKTNNNNNKN